MKGASSMPVLVQVAALAALAVVMSQAVAFAVVLLAPDPRPAGFSIQAAARALKGEPAETSDGRPLRRRITDQPVDQGDDETGPGIRMDPLQMAITAGLAQSLGVKSSQVRVVVDRERPRRPGQRPSGPEEGRMNFVLVRPGSDKPGEGTIVRVPAPPAPPPPHAPPPPPKVPARESAEAAWTPRVRIVGEGSTEVRTELHMRHAVPRDDNGAFVLDSTTQEFTVLADRLTFAPFSASMRLPDGRWATVEPPRDLLSPWQRRLLIALAISMLLLAPLVWWMARRLTRPIRVFAEAAERLGADPDAEPLEPSGPSEVRTAIQAFNEMQASLRDHMSRRAQTIAAIAHDLRTPLTRLRFRAEHAPEAVRDRMAADIEEMDALISQAMAYVRGEATPDRSEAFDLGDLAEDCAVGFSETGAEVVFDGQSSLPVIGDPTALRRGLANLITNALKYGGAARVRAFAENGRAVVVIEDDGPGLNDDELEAVFEPFHRAERSRSRETGGAGLGLTVARQAARAHGGDVVLVRREGGLTARLDLPLVSRT
ncbi:ATP-binding protein [Brevundimonas sp. Root1279]|uniref:ATP-binding protein n=1 Tax=Brevundimonas sp. Root1279 TaxID=1736443 RepID=UPI0006FCCF72|nr:ATP-binding protein [Brevundimonas sp. Root1279]KQW82200.1 hypothetical protein ASC65_07930 [Brevundimonas sp. Root1279]